VKVHILGICGTFMGGVAALAREAGHEVSGSDQNVYPPMSDQLRALGIELIEGWDPAQLEGDFAQIVVGNALTRGKPVVEALLNRRLPYLSGPQWLAENILQDKTVIAVAGTHGKTTTSSMVAHILDHAGLNPGFSIGGVPGNFGVSARLGGGQFFVVEADEYDSAFFDKRAKFVHYRPWVAILNNLEYDHADIYPDVESIRRQFHHLIRTVPADGTLIVHAEPQLRHTLDLGVYTPVEFFGDPSQSWHAENQSADWSQFRVWHDGHGVDVSWSLFGAHNANNAVAAIAASHAVGVSLETAATALSRFINTRRRLEVRARGRGVTVWDDFAHHPTAYQATVQALRQKIRPDEKIIAIIEPRSATQKQGVHQHEWAGALSEVDELWVFKPEGLSWSLENALAPLGARVHVVTDVDQIVSALATHGRPGDHWLVMSNGGFNGLYAKLIALVEGA